MKASAALTQRHAPDSTTRPGRAKRVRPLDLRTSYDEARDPRSSLQPPNVMAAQLRAPLTVSSRSGQVSMPNSTAGRLEEAVACQLQRLVRQPMRRALDEGSECRPRCAAPALLGFDLVDSQEGRVAGQATPTQLQQPVRLQAMTLAGTGRRDSTRTRQTRRRRTAMRR